MSRSEALVYAARPAIVLHHLGRFGVVLAGLGIPPLVVYLLSGSLVPGLVLAATLALVGGGGWLLARATPPDETGIQMNEALVVAAGAFLAAGLVTAVPFVVEGMRPVDALFEAYSGVTTTGLTVLSDPAAASTGTLFNRAWAQWFGGLGYVTLATVLVSRRSVVFRLARLEDEEDDLVGGTLANGKRVLGVYITLTAASLAGLLLLGTAPFDAVIHTLSAVSTGGFSSYGDSISALNVPARGLILVVFALGAVPLLMLHRLRAGAWREVLGDVQLRALLVAGALVSVALFLTVDTSDDVLARAGNAILTGFSAQTTTGYSTWSPADLGTAPLVILACAMFVGGAAGSTAGGIKLVRFVVGLKVIRDRLVRTAMPERAVHTTRIGGQKIESSEALNMLVLVLSFLALIVLAWIPFLFYGYAPLDALFDVVSAAGTVGLSTGVTSAAMEPGLKLVLSGVMLAGRLELIALLVLVSPRTWIEKRKETP